MPSPASRIGSRASVLLESAGRGHDAHYAPVLLAADAGVDGSVVDARITGARDDALLAVAA